MTGLPTYLAGWFRFRLTPTASSMKSCFWLPNFKGGINDSS